MVLIVSGGAQKNATVTRDTEVLMQPRVAQASPTYSEGIVDAITLYKAYDENEVAADETYKGKRFKILGAVRSIDKDLFSNIVVKIRTPKNFVNIDATMDDAQTQAAAALRKGQKVALSCEGRGRVMGSPILADCKFY
jgi:tRNA_anti-like